MRAGHHLGIKNFIESPDLALNRVNLESALKSGLQQGCQKSAAIKDPCGRESPCAWIFFFSVGDFHDILSP